MNSLKFYFNILFDGLYNQGSNWNYDNPLFIDLFNNCIDNNYFIDIIKTDIDFLNNNDNKYIFKYISAESHAIGCLIINNNNNIKTFIFSNTGLGINSYHHCEVFNNITYCKPYIIINNISNIDNIDSLYQSNSIKDLYNNNLFELLLSNNESSISFENFWYPVQISGNCSYLSILLIVMYKLYNDKKICLNYIYEIDFIFKAVAGSRIINIYNNYLQTNKLTQNDYDIIKVNYILADYYMRLYDKLNDKNTSVYNIIKNLYTENFRKSYEILFTKNNYYLENIKLVEPKKDYLFIKKDDIIDIKIIKKNNLNYNIFNIITKYNNLNLYLINKNVNDLVNNINLLLQELYIFSNIEFNDAIYNFLLNKSYDLILEKLYEYFNQQSFNIKEQMIDNDKKILIKNVYIFHNLFRLTTLKMKYLHNSFINISEIDKNISENDIFNINNIEKTKNIDFSKDNNLKFFTKTNTENINNLIYNNYDILVIMTYYILLLLYISSPINIQEKYKKYEKDTISYIYYPNTIKGCKYMKQINNLPIILFYNDKHNNINGENNIYNQINLNNDIIDDKYIYHYMYYIYYIHYIHNKTDNDYINLFNTLFDYKYPYSYYNKNEINTLDIDVNAYIYTKIIIDSEYILYNYEYEYNEKYIKIYNIGYINSYVEVDVKYNDNDKKNMYILNITKDIDNIITNDNYNNIILHKLIIDRLMNYDDYNYDYYIENNYLQINNLMFINKKINYLNNIINIGFYNKDLNNEYIKKSDSIIYTDNNNSTSNGKQIFISNPGDKCDYEYMYISNKIYKISKYLYKNYDNIVENNIINNIYMLLFRYINYEINVTDDNINNKKNYNKLLLNKFYEINTQYYINYNIYNDNINDLQECLKYLLIHFCKILLKQKIDNKKFITIYKILYNTYSVILRKKLKEYYIDTYTVIDKYVVYIDYIIKYMLLYIDINDINDINDDEKYEFIFNKNYDIYINNNQNIEKKIFYNNKIVSYYNDISYIHNNEIYNYDTISCIQNQNTISIENIENIENIYNKKYSHMINFGNEYILLEEYININNYITYNDVIDFIKNSKKYKKFTLKENIDNNNNKYFTSDDYDYYIYHKINNNNIKFIRKDSETFEFNYINNKYIIKLELLSSGYYLPQQDKILLYVYERKFIKNDTLKSINIFELLNLLNDYNLNDIYILLLNLLYVNNKENYIIFWNEDINNLNFTIDFIYDNDVILEYNNNKLYYNNNEIIYNKDIPNYIYIWISHIPYSLIYKKNNKFYLLCIRYNHDIQEINKKYHCDWNFQYNSLKKNSIYIDNINIEIHISGLYVIINNNNIFEQYITLLLFYRKSDCINLLAPLLKQYKNVYKIDNIIINNKKPVLSYIESNFLFNISNKIDNNNYYYNYYNNDNNYNKIDIYDKYYYLLNIFNEYICENYLTNNNIEKFIIDINLNYKNKEYVIADYYKFYDKNYITIMNKINNLSFSEEINNIFLKYDKDYKYEYINNNNKLFDIYDDTITINNNIMDIMDIMDIFKNINYIENTDKTNLTTINIDDINDDFIKKLKDNINKFNNYINNKKGYFKNIFDINTLIKNIDDKLIIIIFKINNLYDELYENFKYYYNQFWTDIIFRNDKTYYNILYYSLIYNVLNNFQQELKEFNYDDLYKSYKLNNICKLLLEHNYKIIEKNNEFILDKLENRKTKDQLIFEFFNGFFIRYDQLILCKNILNNLIYEKNKNIYQLLMGSGKSSVIMPYVATYLYNYINIDNKFKSIIQVMPKDLIKQSIKLFYKGINVYYQYDYIIIDYKNKLKNNIKLNDKKLYWIDDTSLKMYILDNNNLQNNLVIYDEIDTIMDPIKSELNIINHNNMIELDNIDYRFKLIYSLIMDIYFPTRDDYRLQLNEKYINNTFFHITNIDENTYNILKLIYDKNSFLQDYKSYIDFDNKNLNIKNKEINKKNLDIKKLYHIKNIIFNTIPYILTKIHRKDYGLQEDYVNSSNKYDLIAIPYLSHNTPSKGSEFVDQNLTIAFTILSYYDNLGTHLRHNEVNLLLKYYDNLYKQELELLEYNSTSIYKFLEEVNKEINKINKINKIDVTKIIYGINVFDKNDFDKISKTNIGKYNFLYYVLLPKLLIPIYQTNISTIDIINGYISPYRCGFSGTPTVCIPEDITDYKINNIIYNTYDDPSICYAIMGLLQNSSPNIIINNIIELFNIIDQYDVLIDSGAYLISYNINDILNKIGDKIKNIKKYIIFRDDNYDIKIYKINDPNNKIVDINIVNFNLEECFTLYLQKDITGVDIKIMAKSKGLITINYFNRYRDIAQAIFRMRKINITQSINYFMTQNIKDIINKNNILQPINILNWLLQKEIDYKNLQQISSYIQNFRSIYRLYKIKNININYKLGVNMKYEEELLNNNIYNLLVSEKIPEIHLLNKYNYNFQFFNNILEFFNKDETKIYFNILNDINNKIKNYDVSNINNNNIVINMNNNLNDNLNDNINVNRNLNINEVIFNDKTNVNYKYNDYISEIYLNDDNFYININQNQFIRFNTHYLYIIRKTHNDINNFKCLLFINNNTSLYLLDYLEYINIIKYLNKNNVDDILYFYDIQGKLLFTNYKKNNDVIIKSTIDIITNTRPNYQNNINNILYNNILYNNNNNNNNLNVDDYLEYIINEKTMLYTHKFYISFIKYFILKKNINYKDVINIYSFILKPSYNIDNFTHNNNLYSKLISLLSNHTYYYMNTNNYSYGTHYTFILDIPIVYLYIFLKVIIKLTNINDLNFKDFYNNNNDNNNNDNFIMIGLNMIIYITNLNNNNNYLYDNNNFMNFENKNFYLINYDIITNFINNMKKNKDKIIKLSKYCLDKIIFIYSDEFIMTKLLFNHTKDDKIKNLNQPKKNTLWDGVSNNKPKQNSNKKNIDTYKNFIEFKYKLDDIKKFE